MTLWSRDGGRLLTISGRMQWVTRPVGFVMPVTLAVLLLQPL